MKFHEILRQRRLALGLTQEQLAQRLGVSAPAVNKWERNNSYPDITLLPPLARLLEVDLNTLLSFQEELTEEETAVYKRGRNAHSASSAKNASIRDYRMATGFEALVGYLYLTGQYERLLKLVHDGLERIGEFS